MGIFSRKKQDEEVDTTVGPGTRSYGAPRHGSILTVERYHRGLEISFQWPELNSNAISQVQGVAETLQTYIDIALDRVESDDALKQKALNHGGIYPDGFNWLDSGDEFDFVLTFGYIEWHDGTLEFYFKKGRLTNIGYTD